MPTSTPLAGTLNLGPKSAAVMASAGFTSLEQLRQVGAVAAYVKAKRTGANVSLNLLWALEGALSGLHWRDVAREHRTTLLLALEDHERGVAPAMHRNNMPLALDRQRSPRRDRS